MGITELFNQLPGRLRKARENGPSASKKRHPPSPVSTHLQGLTNTPETSQHSERPSQLLQRASQFAEPDRPARCRHSLTSSCPILPADIGPSLNCGGGSFEQCNQSDPFMVPTFGPSTDLTTQQRQGSPAVSSMTLPWPKDFGNSDQSMGTFDPRYGLESTNRAEARTNMLLPNSAATSRDPCADLEAQLLNPVHPYLTQWLPSASVVQGDSWMPWS